MSDLPPNIDAILSSIRARMTEGAPIAEPMALPPYPTAPAPEAPPPPVADIGTVSLAGSEMTIDALLRSLLEPMLAAWIDANAPEIVERLAQAEIRRLTRNP
ncbi:hypothetical protein IP88_02460 [alpha proteobacterium AAP81b]|nr:hypothetical protein IP88_02460 [alpha proteobacterium AAP81b]